MADTTRPHVPEKSPAHLETVLRSSPCSCILPSLTRYIHSRRTRINLKISKNEQMFKLDFGSFELRRELVSLSHPSEILRRVNVSLMMSDRLISQIAVDTDGRASDWFCKSELNIGMNTLLLQAYDRNKFVENSQTHSNWYKCLSIMHTFSLFQNALSDR